ncbi:MAG: peptidyl-prolyl cis-trans isomerase [Xanthomonadaceae bacterium]|nr:peptidyl-prolyl cis-trans isomerase [Xanthomonadaceae bacterium]
MITLHTNHGAIGLELDAEKTPVTVANFIAYAKAGHYDGTLFHRVIPGFMIQGGGFDAQMQQKPTNAPIRNEADNGPSNERGTVAMARTNDPHSATSQFFINLKDNDFLDNVTNTASGWGYCVFGRVVSGMDVIDKIAGVSTGTAGGHRDVPREPVVIERVEVGE